MSGRRWRVGVLGATGAVGQKLIARLADHPWFRVTVVAASERSAGRRYREAAHWLEDAPIPADVAELVVQECQPPLSCDLVLSALDATTAREVEPAFARAGIPVVSNASAFRMEPTVPLLVPEVNPGHVELIARQSFGPGYIVTNPNCVVAGLVIALKPLVDAFGVDAVEVTTMQAISGAGYPGVASLDIVGNAIPWIAGEEEKIQTEPTKILGQLNAGFVVPASLVISAQATRVPVLDGHLLSCSVRLGRGASVAEVWRALADFCSPAEVAELPSAPERVLEVHDEGPAPQPRRHAGLGGGMTVSIGRLRACPVHDIRFVALVHNTIRGAAGAALLNAELLARRGLLEQRSIEAENGEAVA
jgi:aspartate-semialdehyde dehydrogenase